MYYIVQLESIHGSHVECTETLRCSASAVESSWTDRERAFHLTIFGMNSVTKNGSPEMKERYLADVAKGTLHTCFGVTAADVGADITRIKTFATRTDHGYVISDRKAWISKAQEYPKVLLLTLRRLTRTAGKPPMA